MSIYKNKKCMDSYDGVTFGFIIPAGKNFILINTESGMMTLQEEGTGNIVSVSMVDFYEYFEER